MDEKNPLGGLSAPSQNVPKPPPVVPGGMESLVPPPPPPAPPVQYNVEPAQPAFAPPAPINQTPPPPAPPALARKGFPINSKILKILGVFLIIFLVIGALAIFILPRFEGTSSKKVTLSYWGLWEDTNVIQPLIDDFEKKNPNIKVNYSRQDVKQYRERLLTRIENGSGPDVFKFHNTWVPVLSNVILPLPTDVISKEEFNQYYPVIKKDLTRNGAVYGITLGIDTLALYINEDIFQTAGAATPVTWNDFINVAKSLTVKDEEGKIVTAGAALGTYDNVKHAPDLVSLLLVQNGAKLEDLKSTSQNASDALKFYTSFAIDEGNVWDSTLDPSMVAFTTGKLAMYFGYSWDYFNIKAANPDMNIKIIPVPQLPNQEVNIASYWADGVSVKSKYQKEALAFINYLSRTETAEKLFTEQSKIRSFGVPYARLDLEDKLINHELLGPFVKQGKTATSSFFADDTYDNAINSQMNVYLGNAVRSITKDSFSPESAVDTLTEGVSQVLNQYGQ